MVWKKVASSYYDEIYVMLDDIAKIIMELNKLKNWGLLGGNGGAILFFHYYINCSKNKIYYSEYLSNLIVNLIKDIYNTKTLGICNGLSGICWLLRLTYNYGYLECDDINQ